MSPASRRTFLYWLLLLLPTLVVGVSAIQLLRREQERIAQQSAYAVESRQAALAARARLIVENLELLVGDVQHGLLDALADVPADQFDELARDWEANNPLVRTVFLAAENGELLRPDPRTADEKQRGFVRRFTTVLQSRPPWRTESGPRPADSKEEAAVRKEVASNVSQVQSARRDVQQLLKPRAYLAESAKADSVPENAAVGAGNPSADLARADEVERAARTRSIATKARKLQAQRRAALPTGWTAQEIGGRLHVLGWTEPEAGGALRGVELDLAALVSRLGEALPAETARGEGFVLRDEHGRVLHQSGLVPREGASAVLRVPLNTAMLPGWEVAAYLPRGVSPDESAGAFFWIGALLVAILTAAILAGGALLMGQARRAEEEAAQKTSFVANVSHEFKTPLTTIRLYAELLEQGRTRDAAQGGEYLRTIGRETQRLARLVNNALDFSRLEQGQKKFARESVDLRLELARLLDSQSPRLAEMNLELRRVWPDHPVVVSTDRDALEQIMLNLVDNAGKYAVEGGEVTVTLTASGSAGAEVRVADRGPGVPAAHRERIFEKFHRVDDALTAEKSGAGLGLSIARQLARGLGGELRYVERPGGGAEFVLELR